MSDYFKRLGDECNQPHRLDFYMLIFITEGYGIHSIDFQRIAYGPGSIIPIAPHQVQIFTINTIVKGYAILYTPSFVSDGKNSYRLYSDLLLFNSHFLPLVIKGSELEAREFTGIINQVLCEYLAPPDFAKEEILRSLTKLLLIKAERIKKDISIKIPDSDYQLYINFRELLNEELNHEKGVVHNFCTQLAVSEKKLNHVLKTYTGHTAKHIIDERIVLEIKRLLAYSNLTVNEISNHIGFDETTNMVKFFKKHTGNTPLHFRKLILL